MHRWNNVSTLSAIAVLAALSLMGCTKTGAMAACHSLEEKGVATSCKQQTEKQMAAEKDGESDAAEFMPAKGLDVPSAGASSYVVVYPTDDLYDAALKKTAEGVGVTRFGNKGRRLVVTVYSVGEIKMDRRRQLGAAVNAL